MYSVISMGQELMQATLDDEEFARELDQKYAQDQAEVYSLSAEADDVWEDLTGDFFTTLFQELDRF